MKHLSETAFIKYDTTIFINVKKKIEFFQKIFKNGNILNLLSNDTIDYYFITIVYHKYNPFSLVDI